MLSVQGVATESPMDFSVSKRIRPGIQPTSICWPNR